MEDRICRICNRKPAEPSDRRFGKQKHYATMCSECRSILRRIQIEGRMGRKIDRDGKYLNKAGYANIPVNGKYYPEHRIVMEEKLGRKLRKHESVHHINGIRNDNRPGNLELWIKPQPGGIRALDLMCPHCGKPYNQLE